MPDQRLVIGGKRRCLENVGVDEPATPDAAINSKGVISKVLIVAIRWSNALQSDRPMQVRFERDRDFDLIERRIRLARGRLFRIAANRIRSQE